jgi:hypothetical protein
VSGNPRSCYLRGTVIPWHFRRFRCMNPGIVSISAPFHHFGFKEPDARRTSIERQDAWLSEFNE